MGEHNGFFGIILNFNYDQVFGRINPKSVLTGGPPYQTKIMSSE